jgi:predicted RNA-binding protein with PIN domain
VAVKRLIVDGMNVIGSRPNGWWQDRGAAVKQLVDRLRRLAERTGDEVTIVFDGRPPLTLAEGAYGPLKVCYARRSGVNAADDRIIEIIAADSAPETLELITADRALRARATRLGATVCGPRALLEALG